MLQSRRIKDYFQKSLRSDLIAGLTVAVILIPQGMAYALLAGMPPIYGLYGALVPLLVYALFGSSASLSVGPVALMSIIVLSSVSLYAEPNTQLYIDFVLMTALFAGLLQVAYGLLGFGIISNFLSKPVMTGFISAAGIIILISQIKYLMTLEVPRTTSIVQMLIDDFNELQNTNFYSLGLGLVGIGFILLFKRIHKKIPGYLIVAILGTLAAYFFNLDAEGVPVLGDIQGKLPAFYTGFFKGKYIVSLMPAAFVVSLICFIGSFSIAKTVDNSEAKSNLVSAKKELIGLGMAKIAGSFFMAMPSTGSFTRSAVNAQAGAKTQVSGIFTALFIGITLLFFSKWFYFLPEPILAAIVITSVFSLINIKKAKYLYNHDKMDFWIMIATFVLTLGLGIVNGIMLGIGLSLLSVIIRSSTPHFAILGQLPHTESFRNVRRYSQAIQDPKILIMRYDHNLFFGNAEHFAKIIRDNIMNNPQYEKVVLHMGAIQSIDSTAMEKLVSIIKFCHEKQVELVFTNVNGPVRDIFHKSSLIGEFDHNPFYLSVADAVLHAESQKESLREIKERYMQQTNVWNDDK